MNRRRNEWLVYVTDLTGVFIFAKPETPYEYPSPQYLGKQWCMFAAMSGVIGVEGKPPRFHHLRDTFATQALIAGIDIVTVSAILGHKDTATTLRFYARWIPSAKNEAMDKMDDILGEQDDEEEE